MSDIQARVKRLQQDALLARIGDVAQGDPRRWVPVGVLGQELGLPYQETLALSDALVDAGWVQREGGGRLDAPTGPRVHLLPAGMKRLRSARDERNGRAA
jgi:hypothetical protein